MTASADSVVIFVTILAFMVGYWLVGVVMQKARKVGKRSSEPEGTKGYDREKHGSQTGNENRGEEQQSGTGRNDGKANEQQRQRSSSRADRPHAYAESGEMRHAHVLGIALPTSATEIKRAYREQLSKYHPDKVMHLGEEFQRIAAEKTRAIIEAYEYFQSVGKC